MPHDDPLVTLRAGELQVQLAPAAGGSIASFTREWREGGTPRTLHWLRPASAEGLATRNPLAMASFPLVPFCNRIRDGRALFEDREIRMPPNHPGEAQPHPLHGIGWLRPWDVESASDDEAVLRLQVEASEAWPWAFSARQTVTLRPDRLDVVMELANDDHFAMPAGIGHHPYFPHPPGTRLTSRSQAMWEADAEVMPTGLSEQGAVQRLREGVVLRELDLDNNFVGWQRSARVDWPADEAAPARSIELQADAPLDYFVVYCPPQYDFFCAEPVSQCTDWLNLMPQYGPTLLGGTRLPPKDALEARFSLRPKW